MAPPCFPMYIYISNPNTFPVPYKKTGLFGFGGSPAMSSATPIALSIPVASKTLEASSGVKPAPSSKCSDWKYPVTTHDATKAARGTDFQALSVLSGKVSLLNTFGLAGCPLGAIGNVSYPEATMQPPLKS